MNKNYYGYCDTAADIGKKVVQVRDLEILGQDSPFQEGDLLSVYFSNGNTASEVSLVFTARQETNQGVSTSSDEGKQVIYAGPAVVAGNGEWGSGETVLFTYIQLGEDSTQFRWGQVNEFHASEQVYGVTKLVDITKEEMIGNDEVEPAIASWIDAAVTPEDQTTAMTPATLKNFFDLLSKPSSNQKIGLYWEPGLEGTNEKLGTLSLRGGQTEGGSVIGIDIMYPLRDKVIQIIGDKYPTYTGELTNNGDNNGGSRDKASQNINAEKYITRYPPNNIYFNEGNGLYYNYTDDTPPSSAPRIILDNGSGRMIIGKSDAPSQVGVIELRTGTNNDQGVIANGRLNATLGLSEYNEPLIERYSPQIKVIKIPAAGGTFTIPVNDTSRRGTGLASAHIHVDVTEVEGAEGYVPIGVVGYNVNYAGSATGDALYANVWECHLLDNNQEIEFSIYNMKNKPITVTIDVYVLYKKNIGTTPKTN